MTRPRDADARPPLPPAVQGERFEFDSAAGRLSAYVAGQGPPLLLVHSVNAAASVAEVRPLFEHYVSTRTVFALDLPGYGFSERSDRAYTPRLMTDALLAMREPMRRRCGERTVDALAVSLACEFLARAAVEAPTAWRSVALVSPTGFNGRRVRTDPSGSTQAMPWLYRALRGPGWGGALFRALTRPGVVRYFLERTWGGKNIDEELWRYAVITARQPGAEYAPLHFLAGSMFSTDIHSVYRQVAQPVWMSHGVRGDFVDYRGKSVVTDRAHWRFDVFATGAMPYFELPQDFDATYDGFLAKV
jgi:pimeloyl-ACP methyl ester carboxylesterase